MSKIYTDLRALENSEQRLRRLTRELERINDRFKSIRNSLDSDIRYSKGIDGQFSELTTQLSEEEHMIFNSANLLKKAVEDYKASDKKINGSLQKIKINTKIGKTFDLFADAIPMSSVCRKEKIEAEPTSDGGGMMEEALKALPGGERPTEAEIAQMDAIMDKYELILIENYGNISDYDIKEILENMARELEPIVSKHRYDFTWWYYAVNTGCILDVKNSRVVNIKGKEVNIWSQPWKYDGSEGRPDFAGNFLYGYLGAEVFGTGELGQAVLKGGAGFAQFMSDRGNPTIKNPIFKFIVSMQLGGWGDNPGDSDQIQSGINSYINDHGRWGKVIDIEDLLNPFKPPIISMPNIFDPDGILKDGFIEDEPGFLRDIELLRRMTGSGFYYTNFELLPEIAKDLNDKVWELIDFADSTIDKGKELLGDGIEAIGDGFKAAGDLIGDGIEAAGEAIGDGVKSIGDGLESLGDSIHDLLS